MVSSSLADGLILFVLIVYLSKPLMNLKKLYIDRAVSLDYFQLFQQAPYNSQVN